MPRMPEKPVNSWIFPSASIIHWSFKVLMLGFFLGILFVWGIDSWKVSDFHSGFLTNSTGDVSFSAVPRPEKSTSPGNQNPTQSHKFLPETLENVSSLRLIAAPKQGNSSKNHEISRNFKWVSAELEKNYARNLLARWLAPGGEPCKDSETVDVVIPGLDKVHNVELSTGDIHEFVLQAVDEFGNPRCLGGDYFEIDLSGQPWKSRPPMEDFGNGTYKFSLQVHPDFPGNYNLTIILLFRHYLGLKFSPERFAFDKLLTSRKNKKEYPN